MKVLKTIDLKFKGELKSIFFGIPEGDELKDMFKFRYANYLKKGYIESNNFGVEKDEYDDGRSFYFIAVIDSRIIGSVRLIKDEYLPTEKECFDFSEPESMKKVSRDKRVEMGRLIVEKYSDDYQLPRHLVLLGLIFAVVSFCRQKNYTGGYAFIKNSLKIKLDNLKFPIHYIENFKQIYNEGVLKKYFSNHQDIVWPVYYLIDEVSSYIDRIFGNKIFFKKHSEDHYRFRNNFLIKLFNAL